MTDDRQTRDVPEVAKLLGVSRGMAYRLAREGTIPSLKLGRRVLVPKAAVKEFLAAPPEFPETAQPEVDHEARLEEIRKDVEEYSNRALNVSEFFLLQNVKFLLAYIEGRAHEEEPEEDWHLA